MHPFSWPYPIVYLLPDTLFSLIDSPVPIILGVNKSAKQLCAEGVYEQQKDYIFIDLDEHKIYCNNKKIIKKIISEKMNLNKMHNKLEKVYDQINPQGLLQKKPSIFSNPQSKDSEKHKEEYQLKYFQTKQDEQICEIILNIFNDSLKQGFINILPRNLDKLINQESNQIDYQAFTQKVLQKALSQDKPFLQKFITTQIFSYFIENFYQFGQ